MEEKTQDELGKTIKELYELAKDTVSREILGELAREEDADLLQLAQHLLMAVEYMNMASSIEYEYLMVRQFQTALTREIEVPLIRYVKMVPHLAKLRRGD